MAPRKVCRSGWPTSPDRAALTSTKDLVETKCSRFAVSCLSLVAILPRPFLSACFRVRDSANDTYKHRGAPEIACLLGVNMLRFFLRQGFDESGREKVLGYQGCATANTCL